MQKMTGNNSNRNNNVEFKHYDPNEKNTDGRKRKNQANSSQEQKKQKSKEKKATKARRDHKRHKQSIELCIQYPVFRPNGVPYSKVTAQWNKITPGVNKVEYCNFSDAIQEKNGYP